jgi:4-amino-4-deoxy-L-arabinose transferase-like glycosyltransferase
VLDKRILIALFLMVLIVAPWYLKNYILTKNIYFAVMGYTQDIYARSLAHLSSAFQMSQPERFLWDSSGYYPLPIDLLFYVGIFFFVVNLIRTRKLQSYSIFVFIMVVVYFIFQFAGIPFFVIRHEILIFPFLALEIANGIPKNYLKYSLIVGIIFLAIWSMTLPKYSFNQYSETITPACKEIKTAIDSEPVYVNAFHNWFIIYKCNLNATIQNESKWTIDFENGQLYLTNKTNLTNNITGV